MKKIAFLLICSMLLPMAMQAQKKKKDKEIKIRTYESCYIYGQSGRNSEKKGSAVSLTTGMTYSLMDAVDRAGEKDIDIMLYYGKAMKGKSYVFHLFAPENPSLVINWNKEGGTSPYCKFEGKSNDPDAYFALKNWKNRNTTKLERTEDVDFAAATGESIQAMEVEESYIVSDVKVGDVIKFQTSEKSYGKGKKGLILIKAIEDDETKPAEAGRGQYQRLIFDVKIIR